ncbi:hypothetical protein ABPG75_010443 [Micractinium tetrahymenae]
MAAEEEALLGALERLRSGPLQPGGLSGESLVVTGSGFSGASRLAVRELAALAGFEYSGDLVRGHTTHLVLLRGAPTPAASATATAAAPPPQAGACSTKRDCARRWGIPCVRLAWLLDSCEAGSALPVQPYLVPASGKQQAAAAEPQGQRRVAPPPSCQQLMQRARPSSVASSALGAPPAANLQQAAVHGRASAALQQQLQPPPPQQPQEEKLDASRPALAPVANGLADQLRRMSISPEPPEALAAAGSCPAQRQQHGQQHLPQPADSPPLQRSPSLQGSPQHSLSLQGIVRPAGYGSQAGTPAAAGATAAASSAQAAAAPALDRGQSAQQAAPPCGASQAAGSPMQQSPAGGAVPFRFTLGRSRADDLPGGSPMAESPAPGVLPAHSAGGTRAVDASMPRPRSRLAGSPGTEGSPALMCTLPTPACVRDWSDDDSLTASPAPADAHAGSPDSAGVTQTPPHVRQAQAAAAAPTQWQPVSQQQQQQSHLAQQWRQQQQERQSELEAGMAEGTAEVMQQGTPAAAGLQSWADDETVASDGPPAAADLVVSDSESDCEALPGMQQHQQHSVEALALLHDQSSGGASAVPASQQAAEQETVRREVLVPKQKRGLLQVSRPSVAGQQQLRAAPSRAPSAAPSSRQASPGPASPHDEPMPSPGAPWDAEPLQPMSCSKSGSAGVSLGGTTAEKPHRSQQHPEQRHHQQQQRQPSSSSSAGPVVDEHFITRRRPGATAAAAARTAQQQQQRRDVREWSEDDSSGEEFPTPTRQRGQCGGLTGLTQLDPASIVIARPKPSASSATWRSGDDASSGGARGMKFLQRPPRGNAVRAHHGLSTLKGVQFAEQVQVAAANGLVLSTKDKKTAVRLQPGGLTEEEAEEDEFQVDSRSRSRGSLGSGSRGEAVGQQEAQQARQAEEPALAEPQTFYRLPDGTWWLEHCRFYTAAQAEAAAAAAGRALMLPAGFDRSCELLKAVEREYAPIGDITGAMQVRRVKQGSTALRLRGGTSSAARSYFWRLALDTSCWRVVTDQPRAAFVSVE